MGAGSKIYGAYMRQSSTAMHSRRKNASARRRGDAGICPFTLEAIKDCVVRKKTSRASCRFTLEDCLAPR
jgi:hypothetical protein